MAVTITDVARRAGVSPSSVSRTLAAPDRVRARTRERVERAVAELGYRPNQAARALITGRTGLIGLIVPDMANPFFPGVIKAVQSRAREVGYAIILADSDEDPAVETDTVRALADQVEGFILCSPRAGTADLRAFGAEKPVVLLNQHSGRIPSVASDNVDGMRQAVSHLAALGHRRIAYVAGPRTSWTNRERLRGLRAATAALNAELLEIGSVIPKFDGGTAVADTVLATEATAVIAFNDLIALGLLSRCTARGITVPDDLSVVGFDDVPLTGLVNPPLTTVAIAKEQIARVGVDLIMEQLHQRHRTLPSRRTLPTQLIVRGSTGPAPTRRRPGP